jgi:hypothetical protein
LVNIDWYRYDNFSLGKLFDALCAIEGLKLATGGSCSMFPEAVGYLVELLSRNQTIHSLELHNLPSSIAFPRSQAPYIRLCQQLDGQKQIQTLRMNRVTEACQDILGDFIGSSHSLRKAGFTMESMTVTPRLTESIRQNTTLEAVDFKFEPMVPAAPSMEVGIFPFLALFEKNRCTATSLSLDISAGSAKDLFECIQERTADRQGLTAVGSLIANNYTLHDLALCLPKSFGLDLPGIGEGLQRNTSLERLFVRMARWPGIENSMPCPDESTLREFAAQITQNWTVTEIVFHDGSGDEHTVIHSAELTQLSSRNKNFSLHACSAAFIQGAASGLMKTLDYPSDSSIFIARDLLERSPRIAARALAMVNKASSENAVASRRRDILDLVADRLPENRASVDYALRGIAECAFLAADLIHWMDAEPAAYLEVAKRFCDAIGAGVMRKQIIARFSRESDLTGQRLAMLERTFQPDQKHLASLLGEEVDYDSIEPIPLRFFAGYQVSIAGSDPDPLREWCEANGYMPLYRAYLQSQALDQARHFQKTV